MCLGGRGAPWRGTSWKHIQLPGTRRGSEHWVRNNTFHTDSTFTFQKDFDAHQIFEITTNFIIEFLINNFR